MRGQLVVTEEGGHCHGERVQAKSEEAQASPDVEESLRGRVQIGCENFHEHCHDTTGDDGSNSLTNKEVQCIGQLVHAHDLEGLQHSDFFVRNHGAKDCDTARGEHDCQENNIVKVKTCVYTR